MRKPRPSPSAASEPDATRPRRRLRPALVVGVAAVAVLAGLGIVAYGFRGPIGVRLAVDYLEKRGVPAAITIDRLDLGGFSGSMRLGPANDPDLTVERIEAEFGPIPVLTRGLAAPRLVAVRLVRPKLKGRYQDGKLSFGTLQPMIDEILAQPLVTPGPSARIEEGEARIATPMGPLVLTGEAIVDEGRLRRAVGRLQPTELKVSPDLAVSFAGADIDLQGRADRLALQTTVRVAKTTGFLVLAATEVSGEASLPYPMPGASRLDGPVAAAFTAKASRAESQGLAAEAAKIDLRLTGSSSGPFDALALNLASEGSAAAERLTGPGGAEARTPSARFKAARLDLKNEKGRNLVSGQGLTIDLAADRAGQGELVLVKATAGLVLDRLQAEADARRWTATAPLQFKAAAARLEGPAAGGRLSLPAVSAAAHGDAAMASDKPAVLTLTGSAATGQGGLDRKTAAALAKSMAAVADEARVRAALSGFRLAAPTFRLASGPDGSEVWLDRPATIQAAGDIQGVFSAAAGKALFRTAAGGGGSGAANFRLTGAGLPRVSVASPGYRLSKDGRLGADLVLDAGLDAGAIRGGTLKGSGRLDAAAGRLDFIPRGCLAGGLAAFGPSAAPAAADASARICADQGRPLLAAGEAGWRAQGRIEGGRATLPAAAVAAQDAELRFNLSGRDDARGGQLSLAKVRVADTLKAPRFLPINVSGEFVLGQDALTGRASVKNAAKGATLAVLDVRQAAGSAAGSAEIASDLVFATGGLQPADLSPLARGVVSKVDARVRFAGRAAWSEAGLVSSGGRVTTTGAAFSSPAGMISGVTADVTLTSLAPPIAAPGQTVTAQRIDWLIPATEMKAVFGLDGETLTLEEGAATVAHGRVSLAGLKAPLTPGKPIAGVLKVENLDVGELISASSFADSVAMEARVNAALPFTVGPEGIRLTDGVASAVGPGRLSIKRQALTGAVATAGSAGAQPNAVQEFAYQAMEHLAFDSLDAKIRSLPEGRLGAVFHIVGRNDPPGNPQARVGIIDLARGRAFEKPIDLPKGTPIDLTLDTSLNFDELLKAYGEIGRNGSVPVQP